MIKQCICSLCNKKFDYTEYGEDFDRECFKHEILDHLKGDKVCENIIKEAIKDLNQKYNTKAVLMEYSFNPYYKDYVGYDDKDNICISFKLSISSDIFLEMDIKYVDNIFSLTKDMVLDEIEKYFIEDTYKKITGIVRFEDYCGGHGADDYRINDMYLRDIMKRLEGKKIEIRILD